MKHKKSVKSKKMEMKKEMPMEKKMKKGEMKDDMMMEKKGKGKKMAMPKHPKGGNFMIVIGGMKPKSMKKK